MPVRRSEQTTRKRHLRSVFIFAASSSSPLHAFPLPYPPTCHYDPSPYKSGPACFGKPEWRRVPDGKPPLPLSTGIVDLVERFSHLNVRDGIHSKGPPKSQSHAVTVAITDGSQVFPTYEYCSASPIRSVRPSLSPVPKLSKVPFSPQNRHLGTSLDPIQEERASWKTEDCSPVECGILAETPRRQ
jgi:hypothetical protein